MKDPTISTTTNRVIMHTSGVLLTPKAASLATLVAVRSGAQLITMAREAFHLEESIAALSPASDVHSSYNAACLRKDMPQDGMPYLYEFSRTVLALSERFASMDIEIKSTSKALFSNDCGTYEVRLPNRHSFGCAVALGQSLLHLAYLGSLFNQDYPKELGLEMGAEPNTQLHTYYAGQITAFLKETGQALQYARVLQMRPKPT